MSNEATIEGYLDLLSDVIEKAWVLPLSGGKVFIDGEEAREILKEVRALIPEEIRKARTIIADKDQIISQANKEAETIGVIAKEKAKALINQDEIVRQAQAKANELMLQGQIKYREERKASSDYVDSLMKSADDSISETLAELRRTRQKFQSTQKNTK